MTTTTKSRPSVKPSRRICALQPIPGQAAGVLAITVGKKEDVYAICALPSAFGVAFRLIKGELEEQADGTVELRAAAQYEVCLGERPSCECPGFLFHGHCKYVEGLTALRQLNLL